MYKTTLKCSCGAFYEITSFSKEHEDASHATRQQIDEWMETQKDHLFSRPSTPIPTDEEPL